MRRFVLLITILMLILTACAEEGSATDAIEKYLKARIAGDEDKLVDASCPEWEAQARAEAASFQSVDAKINGLTCTEAGEDGDYTLVTCEGTIVIQYRGEDPREQALPDL
ncbi:MAG: hypothetical protein K8S97_15825, partial [Anaerolineae bacterium]|nr:hypothetical protein [Anaerolineae bacterium]